MSNKHPSRPAAPPAPGVTIRPNRFDVIALRAIQSGIVDASGGAFLTDEGAIRLALNVAFRVLSAGRIAEFQGPLSTLGGKDAPLPDA